MFFTRKERMSGVDHCSASGSVEESCWVSSRPSRVARSRSRHPEAAHAMFRLMLDLLAGLNSKIADLDKEIARRAREDEVSRRLMTVTGIGALSATAIAALSTASRDLC